MIDNNTNAIGKVIGQYTLSKKIPWISTIISLEEYKSLYIIENWFCLYEQLLAEKIVNGGEVYFYD